MVLVACFLVNLIFHLAKNCNCSIFSSEMIDICGNLMISRTVIITLKIKIMGTSLVSVKNLCQCRGHRFNFWSEDPVYCRTTEPVGHNY